MALKNIPIRDEFDDPTGRFLNYDAYDVAQYNALQDQRHVNIRSFVQSDVTRRFTMADLDNFGLSALDSETMLLLEGNTPVLSGENWTAGTVTKQADRNHWRGISLTCPIGATTATQSVLTTPTGEIVSIDCYSDMEEGDFFSLALPAFPLASIDLTQSFIRLTSNVDGNFGTGPTTTIGLNESTVPLIAGNSEFRVLRSRLFDNLVGQARIDALSAITGVRFEIKATATCTFRCLAVRLLGADWTYAPVDTDTLYKWIEQTPSLNGSFPGSLGFPAATDPITPIDFPALFWADTPTGAADPSPVNVSLGVPFNTGSITVTGDKNEVRLLLRELPLDYLTQLDLDGSFTQEDLNNYGTYDTTSLGASTKNFHKRVQPDFGVALFGSRTQAELDDLQQLDLDQQTQFQLERIADFLSSAYLQVSIEWSADNGTILKLIDSELNGYTFNDFSLNANTYYILLIELEDDAIQARIYLSDSVGGIHWDQLVYDSTKIIDEGLVQRRKGRVGWYTHFGDGDAQLLKIRSRGMVHGEYRSLPFESLTPVEGASLTVGGSGTREYSTGISKGPWGGRIEVDTQRSTSGKSFKIINDGTKPMQGIQTNQIYIDDPREFTITFALLFPSSALAQRAGLEAFLYGEYGRIIPLSLGHWKPDKWQRIKILPTVALKAQSGYYRLVLIQSIAGVATEWFFDSLSISAPIVKWSGRDYVPDPWDERKGDWIPFEHTVNQAFGGILFPEKRRQFQIRGDALQQDGSIESVRVAPHYAELANFSVEEDDLTFILLPTATISLPAISGGTVTFDGTSSAPSHFPPSRRAFSNRFYLVSYNWTFGDGEQGSGPVINHTYLASGMYSVTLTVTDSVGNKAYATRTVSI